MKKFLTLLIATIVSMQSALAQDNQPPKEMIEQIIALKAFLQYGKLGYKIVNGGLRTVNRIKSGDFSLHDLQFDQLQQITPTVSRYASLSEIALSQGSLLISCSELLQQTDQFKTFTKEELSFCKRLLRMLLNECRIYIDELIQLLTAEELELNESERLNRLVQLKQKTSQLEASVRSLSQEIKQLNYQRIQEHRSVLDSKHLNNLQ